MAEIDWESGEIKQPEGATADADWEQGEIKPPPEPKGFLGHARDLGLSAVKSAIAVPETLVGLADIPTGGRVGKFLENEGGAVGFRPKQAKEFVSEFHTDQYKDQQRQFQEADGILDKTAVAIQNPSLIANTVTESVAPMLAGGVAARGLMAGTRLGQMGAKGAAAAGAIGEGTMMAGSQASAIRQETDDGLLTPTQAGAAVATGLAGTLFGYLGGRVAQRFGLGDVDTMLARGANPQQVASEIAALPAKSVPRQVIEGAITEGFLEELPQSISEQIIQNLALGKPWSEGVEDAAVMGTLAGMAMGGGASLYNGVTRPEPQDGGLPPPAAGNEPPAAPPQGFAPTSEPPVIDEAALGRAGVFPPAPAPIINERALAPLPSQQMGLDPAAGPMSAAAALAVDTGASATMQQAAQAVDPETGEILEAGARVPEQKQATDTPDRMRERLGFIERQARVNGGWDRRTLEERDRLQAELAKAEPAADQVRGATEMIEPAADHFRDATKMVQPAADQSGAATEMVEPAPAIDVTGRTDEQLRVLERAGRDGWREAAVAEIQRRAAQQPVAAPELEAQPVAADAPTMAAPQAEAAPVADIKAVIAKQIPDMTDGDLQQAIAHYGPEHKRTAKLQKELQKRGQGAQTTAAIAPGDSVQIADGLGSDVDGQPGRVVSVRGDTASVEVAGERYDDVPVSELKKQASAAASEGWDGMTAEQRAAILTKPGGWATAKGGLNVIGKKLAGQNWTKINPTTRATIERLMQGVPDVQPAQVDAASSQGSGADSAGSAGVAPGRPIDLGRVDRPASTPAPGSRARVPVGTAGVQQSAGVEGATDTAPPAAQPAAPQGDQPANVPPTEQVAPQAQEARGQEGEKAKWIKAAVDKSRLNGSGGVQLAVAPNGGVTFMGDPNTSKDGRALLANYEKALAAGATQQEIAAAIKAQKAQGQAAQAAPEQDRRPMPSGLSFPSERIVTNVQGEFEALEVQASSIGTSDGYVNFGSQYPDGRYYIESAGKSIGFANGQWGDVTPEGLKPRGTYDPDNLQAETIRVLEGEGAKRSKAAEPARAPAENGRSQRLEPAPFFVLAPGVGADERVEMPVWSMDEARQKVREYIKRTGMTADQFGAGVQVFDAETGQPAARVNFDGEVVPTETMEQARARSEQAVAQQDAVAAQPTAPRFDSQSGTARTQAERDLWEKGAESERAESDVGVTAGTQVRFVPLADAVATVREAEQAGVAMTPFQVHQATGIRIGDAERVIREAQAPADAARPDDGATAQPEAPEFTTLKDRDGKTVTVRTADISSDRERMPMFTKDGKRKATWIHRDNLDPTGEKQAEGAKEMAGNPLFNVITTKDGGAFASEGAAERELRRRGLQDTHEVVPASEVSDGSSGFVVRRTKTAAPAEAVEQQQPDAAAPAWRTVTSTPFADEAGAVLALMNAAQKPSQSEEVEKATRALARSAGESGDATARGVATFVADNALEALASHKINAGRGSVVEKARHKKLKDGIERLRSLEVERVTRGDEAPAAVASQPTHKDPGQPAEPVTQPVITEAIQKSARNTDFNPAEAKAWILGEIDKAIAVAPTADRIFDGVKIADKPATYAGVKTWSVDGPKDADGLTPSLNIEQAAGGGFAVVWGKSPDQAVRAPNLELAKEDAARIVKTGKFVVKGKTGSWQFDATVLDAKNFVTFDVPGDGKFKVVNTVEKLRDFRAKVEKSPGFAKNPDRPMNYGSGMAGAVNLDAEIRRIEGLSAADRRYQGGDVLEEIGNAIEIARLKKSKDEGKLLDRFKEASKGKDYDAWRAEQEAAEETAAREASARQRAGQGDPQAFAQMMAMYDQPEDAAQQPEQPAKRYAGPSDVSSRDGQMELANRAGTIAALKAMNAQLRAVAPDEAWADANIEDAANLDALRDQISVALVRANRAGSAEQDSPLRKRLEEASGAELRAVFDALGLAGGARMIQADRVKALMSEDAQAVSDALDDVQSDGEPAAVEAPAKPPAANQPALTGPRRNPAQVSAFTPYAAGDIVAIDGQDWQVQQDMGGWYLTSTGNWRGMHPTIQKIRGMNELIAEIERAATAQPAAADPGGATTEAAATAADLLTPDQARTLMTWEDLGQRDNVKSMRLAFFESAESMAAKRGAMNYGTIESYQGGKWNIDGTTYPTLKAAKAAAEEAALVRLANDGYVAQPFAAYDAVARTYGYEVRADGAIGSEGKFHGPTIKEKGGRLRVESSKGDLLGSYPAAPESLGRFLESFWGAEKQVAQPAAEQPASDRDQFTVERVDEDQRQTLTFVRGETVKVSGKYPMETGQIDGISNARKEFRIGGAWLPFGYAYKTEYDEFAAPRRELEEMIANAEKRIADGNGFQRDGYPIRDAREHAKRYSLEGYDDTLNDLAKRGQAVFDRRIAEESARIAAAKQTDRERREAADAADAAKYAGPVKMTMDEWKRIHRDFKSFNGGNRTVMQDGRIRRVEIIKEKVEAPATEAPAGYAAQHEALMASVRTGKATPEAFKASFEQVVANEDAIKAELSAKTKAALLRDGGPYLEMRYANEKKDSVVDAVYRQMIGEYALGESVTYGMARDSYQKAVRRMVEATDADKLAQYVRDREAAIQEAEVRRTARAEAMANPQTLNDYRSLMNEHIREGKTRHEAFLMLTPEQRIRYDELEAEGTREAREARKRAAQNEVRAAGQTTGGQIITTKHTRDGHDLFVVQLAERLSREDYNTVLAGAKRLGGRYSAFRGNGAVPGFQFRTREDAEAFLKLAGGDVAAAKDQVEQRRDAFADDRSQTAAERLVEMADRMEQDASAEENRDRKANTARRARFASAALNAAAAQKAMARTMRNIALAIQEGRAKFLDAVRTRTQVEALLGYVRTAKDNELRAKYPSYAEQEKRKGEPATAETAGFADFPSYTAFRSDLAMLGRQMLEIDGTKKLGQKLMSAADDVTDAYLEFARDNIRAVSQFGRGDALAEFASRDDAERAIRRSGLVGKAIVLPIKRGQNRVILSPSEAMSRKVWAGDGDKRITLSGEFGKELVEAVGRRGNKTNGLAVPWQFQNAYDRRKLLSRIGIETPSEFRSALREVIALQETAVANKVREMELAMVGRRADGLDFFPTPAEIADQMVEAADIKPDMAVLEPSAGMGHLADRIREAGAEPDVVEISAERRELLEEKGYHLAEVNDFMNMEPRKFFTYGDIFRAPDGKQGILRGLGSMGSQRVRLEDEQGSLLGMYQRDEVVGVAHRGSWSGYDRIIMNPPFSDRRDAEHVQHAYTLLRPGGRIVAIMGEGVFFGQDKRAQDFRDWLDSVGGTSEKLPEGSFMDPSLPVQTGVNARMVVIDRPAVDDGVRRPGDADPEVAFSATLPRDRNAVRIGITEKGLVRAMRLQFDGLADVTSKLLERGRAGKRGGVIVVGTADNAEIGRIVAERTGRKLDSTMRKFSSAGRLNGFYDPKTGLTFLVGPNLNPVTATAVMLHEMMHGQQRKKLDARALEMVRNRHGLKDEDLRAFLDRVMLRLIKAGEVGNAAEASAYIVEQAVIEGRSAGYTFADNAFMQWVDAKIGKRVGDFLRSFAGMIRTWMLRNGLGAKTMTVDDFVGYAMAGLDRAAAGEVRGRSATVSASQSQDEQFRETERAYGAREAYERAKAAGRTKLNYRQWVQVRTPAFKEWFGDWENGRDFQGARSPDGSTTAAGQRAASDSGMQDAGRARAVHDLVLDPDTNEPRVFFHGTRDDIAAFDLNHRNRKDAGWLGRGVYVTSDNFLAESYSNIKAGEAGANVMPLFVRASSPYMATLKDKQTASRYSQAQIDTVTGRMKAAGHDGAALVFGDGTVELVVFDPRQVKSATGNRGTFDPDNDDIRFSRSVGDAPAQEAQRVQAAIEGKTLIEAAQFLTRSKDGAKAAVAQKVMEKLQRLEKAGVALDLKVVHRGDMVPASMANSRGYTETGFDDKGRDVVVWLNGADVTGKVGTEEEVLLHELVHAATAGMVFYGTQTPNSLAGKHARDLMAVTDAIAEHIRERFAAADAGKATLTEFEQDMRDGANNAFRSDDEVLAWALSNSEAQAYLETIPYRSGSMWSNFVQAVRNLLGLGARNDTALSEVLRVAERILTDDAPNAGRAAFWHKRNIRMAQQQVRGSIAQTAERGADDLQFSRSGLAGAQEAAKNIGAGLKAITVQDVKRAGKHKLTDWLKLGLQFLGRRQIVDVYGDVLPLAEYDRLAAQMEADKNDVGAAADELARRWGKLPDEGKLADLMHDATLAQIDADSAVEYVPGDDLAKSRALKAQFGQLSTEAQKVYREARDHYRKHHAEVRQAIIDRIMRSELREDRRAELLQRMDADFFKSIKGVYFPLSRFGQYVVATKDDAGKVVSVSRAETMAEAEAMRAEMVKAFPARDGYQVGRVTLSKEFIAGRDMVGRGFMTELYEALDEQGLDPRVQAELEDTLGQLYLSSLPDLSWAKHGIHRKGTPGFSSDARRAFAQNTFHGARYLAKLKYGDQMQSELDRMQKHVDEMAPIEGFDQPAAQRVVDEMNKRHEATMNPKGNPLSTALTSFGFVYYLGISPAAAMVNLSQTPLVAYPVLGAKWGFRKASAALMTASKETMEGKNDLRARLKNPDEIAAYDEAVRTGVIDVTMAHDLAGIAQGEDAKVMWKIRPVMRLASYLFHHAERFNRQATFLAAYRLARDAGAKHDTAYSQAVKATYDGHFDYSTGNRPRVMQGNVAKVVLLFKQYAQNMIYTLARNAYQSVKGESPEVRREARKVFGALMTMHAAAAGVLGLPMVGTLLTLASALGGSDDEPWDAEVAMRNMLADTFGAKPAEVIAKGFSRLTPWDISGRVGLDKLLLPDVNESLEGQRWAESFATAMLGPVIGMGVNAAKGAQKMADGDYGRGLEDMLPIFARNPIKAYRQYSEGEVDRTGVVIKDEVSLAGVLGQASGFSPSEIRLAFEGRSAVMSADRRLAERRQDLMTQFARAAMDQDQDGMTEARAAIADFNKVNPGRRITPPQLWQSVRNRERRIREADEGVYLPRTRRDVMAEGRFAEVS